jgi:hypothetical protein
MGADWLFANPKLGNHTIKRKFKRSKFGPPQRPPAFKGNIGWKTALPSRPPFVTAIVHDQTEAPVVSSES